MADDLENYLAGQPVKAQPDSRTLSAAASSSPATGCRWPPRGADACSRSASASASALWQANEARDSGRNAPPP